MPVDRPASVPPPEPVIGPLLYARGTDPATGRHALSVLLAVAEGAAPPRLAAEGAVAPPRQVDRLLGLAFHRYDFSLPPAGGAYAVAGRRHAVCLGTPKDDLRVAFVSCNGKEEGDFDRPPAEREAMWERLRARHRAAPFSLMLMGGDQIYADGALAAHPDLARWAALPAQRKGRVAAGAAAERAATAFFLDRWRRSVSAAAAGALMAEVPVLAMWDDHDIFDGYGSHPAPVQDSPVGRMLYRVARRFFRLFQAGGHDPADPATLSRTLPQPGFAVLAPDLRSERRPDRVMGPAGWAALEAGMAAAPAGAPVFLVSTVPALGPRLSLVEGLHRLVPGVQKYEDDLRDQWQSRAHRAEWRRLLALAVDRAERRGPVTFLSGEIHLAARGELTTPGGAVLHQLTASGISHPPPPRAFAAGLGALGALGGAPFPGHRLALPALPGTGRRYVAERNLLVLERRGGAWRAAWELEESGPTPWLALPGPPARAAAMPGGAGRAAAGPR